MPDFFGLQRPRWAGGGPGSPFQGFGSAPATNPYSYGVGNPAPEYSLGGPTRVGGAPDSWLAGGTVTPTGNVFDPMNPVGFNKSDVFAGPGRETTQMFTPQNSGTTGRYDPNPMYHVARGEGQSGGAGWYAGDRYDENGVFRPVYSNQSFNYNPFTANAPGTYNPESQRFSFTPQQEKF